jgi:hypothetical protein
LETGRFYGFSMFKQNSPMAKAARVLAWGCRCAVLGSLAAAAAGGVQIRQQGDIVRVEINGKLFTEYHYRDASKPFLYPILGPGDLPMTRNWPMKNAPAETQDHPHHRSLWWAHGDVNGVDFWSESPRAGRTVQDCFLELKSGPDKGVIKTRDQLISKEGRIIGTVEETMTFYNRKDDRLMDFTVKVMATHGDLVFGDTKEGTMALRLAESMRLKPNKFNVGKPTGHIVTSEGARDNDTWGKRAAWVDYYGPVRGQIVGVAMFDHPDNPRHPTWWHVRNYGLFAANPFGVHYFEGKPKGAGDYKIPAGESRTWKYRIYFHRGNEQQAHVAEAYQAWVRETNAAR